MLHLAALASVLFLVQGNLMAALVQTIPIACESQGCGCPAPKQDDSSPAFATHCCCAVQPAEAPQDRPSDPMQAPKWPASGLAGMDAVLTEVPGATSLPVRIGERPGYLAHPPPDPLFLRYQSLRL